MAISITSIARSVGSGLMMCAGFPSRARVPGLSLKLLQVDERPAVHQHSGSGHVARQVRSQEYDAAGHVAGLAQPSEWNARLHVSPFLGVGEVFLVDVSRDRGGHDRVETNPGGRPR